MKRKSAEGSWRVVEVGLLFCPMTSTSLPSPPVRPAAEMPP